MAYAPLRGVYLCRVEMSGKRNCTLIFLQEMSLKERLALLSFAHRRLLFLLFSNVQKEKHLSNLN